MTKELSKEITPRSILRNNFLKNRTEENKMRYTKQRNKIMSLLKNAKKKCYGSLDAKKVKSSKQFWEAIKPLISDKSVSRDQINLTEEKEIVKSKSEAAEVLNKFFSNIVKNLGIPAYDDFDPIIEKMKDPVFKAILKNKNHPSILAITDIRKNNIFCFKVVNYQRNRKGNK